MAPQEMPTEGERGPARLLQNALLKDGERKPKVLPLKGKHMPEALLARDAECRGEALRQGCHKLDVPSRADQTEESLVTWDPGGKPAEEEIVKTKGPVEAMDTAPGINAHNKNDVAGINETKETWPHQNQSEGGTSDIGNHAPLPIFHHPVLSSRNPPVFRP